MGYKIVAVNPLKAFPIASFGLADVVGLADAKKQIFAASKKAAQMKIDADDARADVNGGEKLNADERTSILGEYQQVAEKGVADLEARWPKIKPALEAHLARQARRLAHFKASCRVAGCNNPHRQKRGAGGERATKARRPGVRPLFCGPHIGIRLLLDEETLAALHASSEKRVAIA